MKHHRSSYHLYSEHKHCLQGELSSTVLKQVLQARSQEVNYHHVEVPFLSEVVQFWKANYH